MMLLGQKCPVCNNVLKIEHQMFLCPNVCCTFAGHRWPGYIQPVLVTALDGRTQIGIAWIPVDVDDGK